MHPFTIKQNNSNAPITLTLYDGATSVDTVTVSAASVSNSYTATNFDFSTPYQIVSGHKYYVTLTSSAAVNGDHQYDIKEPGSAQLADAKGSPLAPVSNAPEPGTWGMMAGGFALCVIGTRKRKTHRITGANLQHIAARSSVDLAALILIPQLGKMSARFQTETHHT